MKKIALVILFVAVTGTVGFFLYRMFFAPAAPPAVEEPAVSPVSGLPLAGEGVPPSGAPLAPGELPGAALAPARVVSTVADGGPTATVAVVDSPVISPTLAQSGSLSYYNTNDDQFYAIGPDGQPRALSNKKFPRAENVTWSPQADKAIIEFPDENKVVFDFETQTQVTLPKHWQEFSFGGDGETFAAKSMAFDPDNRWLITVNADGSGAKLVEHIGNNAKKVTVAMSPDSSVVAMSQTGTPVGFDTREVLLIGQNNENFKSMRVEGFGFIPKWSPDGKNLLYSASSAIGNYRPTLWLVSAKGESIGKNRTNLQLNTWADKCTFANDTTVYCAVPDNLPGGVGLQRDLAETNPDSIYKLDLRTGASTLIGRPENDTAIKSIVISKDGRTLYFQGALAGGLNSMKLR